MASQATPACIGDKAPQRETSYFHWEGWVAVGNLSLNFLGDTGLRLLLLDEIPSTDAGGTAIR